RRSHAAQWQEAAVPAIEVADDPDAARVRRPDGEGDAVDALVGSWMRAQDVIQPLVRSLGDEVEVDLADRRPEAIRIVALPGLAVGEGESLAIRELMRS